MESIRICYSPKLREDARYIQNILSSLFLPSNLFENIQHSGDKLFSIFIIQEGDNVINEYFTNILLFIHGHGNSKNGVIYFQGNLKEEDFSYSYFFDFISNYLMQYNSSIDWDDYKKTLVTYSDATFSENYFCRWHNDLPIDSLDSFSLMFSEISVILDAGCGPGHHSHYLNKKGHIVYGIDLSEAFVNIAKKQYPNTNTRFIVGDMGCTPFDNETFNGIWCCAALIHIPKIHIANVFREFYRILKPDGLIVVTMCIGQNAHRDAFNRWFESYYGREELFKYLPDFEIIDIQDTYTKKSTQGELILVCWLRITLKKRFSQPHPFDERESGA